MIIEQRNKPPFIHFGFNRQTFNTYKNESVDLWQDTLTEDEITFNAPNILVIEDKIKLNKNKYSVLSETIGVHPIECFKNGIKSNTIFLNVQDNQ